MRHAVLALTVLLLASIYSNIVIFNVTLLFMGEHYHENTPDLIPTIESNSSLRFKRQAGTTKVPGKNVIDTPTIDLNSTDAPFELEESARNSDSDLSEIPQETHQNDTNDLIISNTSPVFKTLSTIPATTTVTTTTKPKKSVVKTGSMLPARYFWKTEEESVLLSVTALGAIASVLPFAYVDYRLKPRITMTIAAVLSAVGTGVLPAAADTRGFFSVLLCRVLQGVAFGITIPVLATVIRSWSPLRENNLFITTCSCFIQIAVVFAMSSSSVFIHIADENWSYVYYFHSLITLILAGVWILIFRNNPKKHPHIRGMEVDKIIAGKLQLAKKRQMKGVPYKEMLGSVSLWTILIASFGSFLALQMLIIYLPSYLYRVLQYPITDVSFAVATPFIVQFVVKLTAGYAAGRARCRSSTFTVRVLNTIALVGAAALLVAAAFLGADERRMAMVVIICAATVWGE